MKQNRKSFMKQFLESFLESVLVQIKLCIILVAVFSQELVISMVAAIFRF